MVVIFLVGMSDDLFACHKKDHDCRAEIGPPNIRELPFRVARNRGFFDGEHVNPKIVSAEGDERSFAALANGQTLISIASPGDAGEVLKGSDIRIIAVLQQESDLFLVFKSETPSTSHDEMQKLPASEAQTNQKSDLSSLRGGTIGIAGTDSQIYLGSALSKSGVEPSSYKALQFSSPINLLESVRSGQLAAAVIDSVTAFEAQRRGLILVPLSPYLGPGMQTVVVGDEGALKAEQDGVVRILQALRKAAAWIYDVNNRSEVIGLIQKEYNVKSDLAAFMYEVEVSQLKTFSADMVPTNQLLTATNKWLSGSGITLRAVSVDQSYIH
jgi:ABC-type nitrate/sulfonate/bicarbonate transport system substrate-binding protein